MKKILIIDDDSGIAETLSIFLSRMGHQVKVAYDGEQGIKLMKRGGNFNLVITDIDMPKMSGNEVARYIRKTYRPSDINVVAITGFTNNLEKNLFDGFLAKPFKIKNLVDLIELL